jgi:hypothetical protein
LGILLNSQTIKKINFIKSPTLKTINVGVTCESCSIADCEARQSPPIRLEKEYFNSGMKTQLKNQERHFVIFYDYPLLIIMLNFHAKNR